jgi:hypothetical protein
MNHDAKYSGGIFRKRPSTASTSSGRMSLQPSRNGSLSCPASPRKHLPALPVTLSDMSFHDVHTISSSYRDGPRIHRSPSATTYNGYSSRQYGQFSYTGLANSHKSCTRISHTNPSTCHLQVHHRHRHPQIHPVST